MILPKLLEWYHYIPYDPLLITPIGNHPYCAKPIGGLWTSPVGSYRSWGNWCINNEYGPASKRVLFELRPCNVLHIHSLEDIMNCPLIDYAFGKQIDFSQLSHYDAIWITIDHIMSDVSLYALDCDTFLVLSPDVISVVHKQLVLSLNS